jgi:hypothetical protein
MVELALGFCTNLSNGNLMCSSVSSSDIKVISPFLMPPFAESKVSDEEKNRIEELQRNRTVTNAEVDIMTSMMIGLPRKLLLYIHFLNNLHWLMCILWNADCYATSIVHNMKDHASDHKAIYREHFSVCWFF